VGEAGAGRAAAPRDSDAFMKPSWLKARLMAAL
jgi:hypothetical protein